MRSVCKGRALAVRAMSAVVGLGLLASAGIGVAMAQGSTELTEEERLAQGNWADMAELYTPEITENGEGVLIQRTPSENISPTAKGEAKTYRPENNVPYNTYWLNADAKGCGACHSDLAELVATMPADHQPLTNDLGIEITVQMCLDCHMPAAGSQTNKNAFARVIHGIHSTRNLAGCMDCHDMTERSNATSAAYIDGQGVVSLWDSVKHQAMRGIESIPADELGDGFSYRIDETIDPSALFTFFWNNNETNYAWEDLVAQGAELDQGVFDNWTITVSGEVDEERTWTLPELIAEAPSVTQPMKIQCILNPNGGPLIGQVEVTGIPVSWLLDQCGLTENAKAIVPMSSNGDYGYGTTLQKLETCDALLVYEMAGEPLSWKNGYPCWYIIGGDQAGNTVRWPSDLLITSDELTDNFLFKDGEGRLYNSPNVGLFDVYEGQIVQNGEPFEFHGYADAFCNAIDAIEISFDQGKTWKTFETPDTTVNQWTTWTYEFTPEEDRAYVITVRGVDSEGNVTQDPVEKMIVAKSQLPEVE